MSLQLGLSKIKLFENNEYIKFFVGLLLAHFADAVMQIVLIAWLVSFLTTAGSNIAAAFFFFLLPQFLLSPISGVIADKFNRKKIMVLSNIFRCAVILLIVLVLNFSNVESVGLSKMLWIVYLFAFLLGLGYSFFYSAKMSFITNIVDESDLKSANAINSGCINFINIFGVAVAGFMIPAFGLSKLLLLTAALYFAATAIFSFIKVKYLQIMRFNNKILSELHSGFKYLSCHKIPLSIILLSICVSLIIGIFINNLNTLAIDYFKSGVSGVVSYRVALGIGTIFGMFLAILVIRYKKFYNLLLAAFGVMSIIFFLYALIKSMFVWYLLFIPFGIAIVLIWSVIDTVFQKFVPKDMLGKIYGIQLMLNTSAFLAGAFIIAKLTLSPVFVLPILGLLSALTTIFIAVFYFRGKNNE